jgi:hypothetical protein
VKILKAPKSDLTKLMEVSGWYLGFFWHAILLCFFLHKHIFKFCLRYSILGNWWCLVMVWHFVSSFHNVMTALIVMSPSKYCCRDFSAISLIYLFLPSDIGCWIITGICGLYWGSGAKIEHPVGDDAEMDVEPVEIPGA